MKKYDGMNLVIVMDTCCSEDETMSQILIGVMTTGWVLCWGIFAEVL